MILNLFRLHVPTEAEGGTETHKHSCGSLLGLVVWRLTDAVQLLCAARLAPFTLHTDVVVHLLGLLLRDAHTLSMIPVGTQVAANVEPLEKKMTGEGVITDV